MQKIQYIKIDKLKNHPNNPRTIQDHKFKTLCESIRKNPDYFETRPILCNKDFVIFAGNMRFNAAQTIGMKEVPVAVMNIPEKRQREIMLRDNVQQGDWNWSKLATDFDIQELLASGFSDTDLSNIWGDLTVEDDNFNEVKELEKAKTTTIKTGDIFQLGKHRLICADSTDPNTVKRLLGKEKVDLINIDFPYNIGVDYSKGIGGKQRYGGTTNDKKSDVEYYNFLKSILQNTMSVSKEDCHVFTWLDEKYIGMMQEVYKEIGISFKRLCLWCKGAHNPTPQIAFNRSVELCMYGLKGKPYLSENIKNLTEFQNKEIGTGNRAIEDIMDIFQIWLVKRLPANEYQHSTMKPPTLYEKSIRRCSKTGDVVLDSTAGSGSILVSCEALNRKARLAEIEPIFCQLIINRFKKLYPNEKVIKLN
ncbi:MAG: DNA methyltransferase [bacterium]